MAIKQAMILAAGFGTRLREFTVSCPKPLMDVGGMPLIDHTIQHLREAGVTRCVVNTHHMHLLMQAHLQQVTGIATIISHELEILETGGGMLKALPHFANQPFLAINGDIWWHDGGAQPLLQQLIQEWDDARHDVLLALCPVASATGYTGVGDYQMLVDGRLQRNKQRETSHAEYVYGGIALLHPRAFVGQELRPFSVVEVFDQAQAAGRLCGVVYRGQWSDIGTPESLTMTRELVKNSYAASTGTSA